LSTIWRARSTVALPALARLARTLLGLLARTSVVEVVDVGMICAPIVAEFDCVGI